MKTVFERLKACKYPEEAAEMLVNIAICGAGEVCTLCRFECVCDKANSTREKCEKGVTAFLNDFYED